MRSFNLKLALFTIVTASVLSLFYKPPKLLAQQYGAYYNACTIGPICDLGEQYYSPGDYVIDDVISFTAEEEKIVPNPYYEEFKTFVCPENDCVNGAGSTNYCEIGAVRSCTAQEVTESYCVDCVTGTGYCPNGWIRECSFGNYQECKNGKWIKTILPEDFGNCPNNPSTYTPTMECTGTAGNVPGSWQEVPQGTPETGRCEDMQTSIKVAFTPGYVKTRTPYLYNIWQNTVGVSKKVQTIFSPFRTALEKPQYDWPGESTVFYGFTNDYAEAGFPPDIHPGWDAKIYFRYLGYIHCAKENLLNKLASLVDQVDPYIYYDERCNQQWW